MLERLEKDDGVQITLISNSTDMSNKKKAEKKLHSQFSHPTSDRLIRLVDNTGLHEDRELKEQICNISEECTICQSTSVQTQSQLWDNLWPLSLMKLWQWTRKSLRTNWFYI